MCTPTTRFPQSIGGFGHRVLKGKSVIAVARLGGPEQSFTGEHHWARSYAVSTVGLELEQIHRHIREQEKADGSGGSF